MPEQPMLKRCSVCKDWLPLNLFYKNKTRKDGLTYQCRSCTKTYDHEHYKANKEQHRIQAKKWHKANRERIRALAELWRKNNPEKVRESSKKANAKRYATIKGRLAVNVKQAIARCLRHGKNGHTFELLGYSVEQLKKHLTKTMPKGYYWADYLTGKLHIDHKIPVSVHNFESTEDIDFGRCWALSNLQLLPSLDNIKKGAKLERHFQPSLIFN